MEGLRWAAAGEAYVTELAGAIGPTVTGSRSSQVQI